MVESQQKSAGPDYKSLVMWQKSMAAEKTVYGIMPQLPREETYGMRSQLTRAVVSIPANIAEGWARETRRDTAHFLAIANSSLAETETLLPLSEELNWMTSKETENYTNFWTK